MAQRQGGVVGLDQFNGQAAFVRVHQPGGGGGMNRQVAEDQLAQNPAQEPEAGEAHGNQNERQDLLARLGHYIEALRRREGDAQDPPEVPVQVDEALAALGIAVEAAAEVEPPVLDHQPPRPRVLQGRELLESQPNFVRPEAGDPQGVDGSLILVAPLGAGYRLGFPNQSTGYMKVRLVNSDGRSTVIVGCPNQILACSKCPFLFVSGFIRPYSYWIGSSFGEVASFDPSLAYRISLLPEGSQNDAWDQARALISDGRLLKLGPDQWNFLDTMGMTRWGDRGRNLDVLRELSANARSNGWTDEMIRVFHADYGRSVTAFGQAALRMWGAPYLQPDRWPGPEVYMRERVGPNGQDEGIEEEDETLRSLN